jgi:hypothetical protein
MATPALPESTPETKPNTEKMLELFSKALAGIAIAVYASGFLITSLYHASYGFIESDPLRPRILFAGAWFALFISAPIMLTWQFAKPDYWASEKTILDKLHDFIFDYYTTVSSIAFSALTYVFVFDQTSPVPSNDKPYSGLRIALIIVCFIVGLIVVFVITALINGFIQKHVSKIWRSRLWFIYLVGTALFVLLPAYRNLTEKHYFSTGSLVLWFALIGIAFVGVSRLTKNRLSINFIAIYALVMFPAVTSFATIYYPHIKNSWGGGEPVQAIITLTKDSPILPLQDVPVSIIDESSLGFYAVAKGDQKATFIPRTSVGFIHFSSDPSKQFNTKPH